MTQKRAGNYLRISDDREGTELGIARQDADTRALAKRLGVEIVETYPENDVGASTRSKKPRPHYDRMIEDVEKGRINYILAYSNSRITRRPAELDQLIKLHERTGVSIVTCVSGSDDLSTADGRMLARIKADVDAAEAERTGERVARKHVELAQAGRPSGGIRPFGFLADKIAHNPAEVALIEAAAADVLNGRSIRSIAAEWNEKGVLSPFGNPWRVSSVRNLLRSPRLAGYRRHQNKIAVDENGLRVKAVWEPVIEPSAWERLQVVLTNPSRRTNHSRPGAAKSLLTGLVRCGRCAARLYGNPSVRDGVPHPCYNCSTGVGCSGLSIDAPATDRAVQELVLLKIQEKLPTLEPEVTWPSEERLAAAKKDKADLMDALRSGRLSAATVIPTVEALEGEIRLLDAEKAQWLSEVVTAPQPVDVSSVEEFEDLYGLEYRREVMTRWLQAVVIQPAKYRGKRFDVERIVPVWRELP
jgi:site-specific DNA recombinase